MMQKSAVNNPTRAETMLEKERKKEEMRTFLVQGYSQRNGDHLNVQDQ